jgi:hypothetical protein
MKSRFRPGEQAGATPTDSSGKRVLTVAGTLANATLLQKIKGFSTL